MAAARIAELLMWTAETRGRYNLDHLRYPSDLTDAEWIEIAPQIAPARSGGRRREGDVGNLVNGVINVLIPGCRRRPITIESIGSAMPPSVTRSKRVSY